MDSSFSDLKAAATRDAYEAYLRTLETLMEKLASLEQAPALDANVMAYTTASTREARLHQDFREKVNELYRMILRERGQHV